MANARHYTPRSFFRHVPNVLLRRFFAAQGLMAEVDFESMSETKADALFDAWLALDEGVRSKVDAEFQKIFDLSCERGFRSILDEARWHMRQDPDGLAKLVEALRSLPDHFHRAMVTYLDHHECWYGATLFYHADQLPYWRKRKNLGHQPAAVDDQSVAALESGIRDYFRLTEGRGNNCTVEMLRRGDRDYYFCYPEDYSQESVEWENGEFARRAHKPAFEVVFVYSQAEGTLDLNFRGARKAAEALQGIFATTILKLEELPPDPKDERVYDLNPLASRSFEFTWAPDSGIEDVFVRKLRLSSKVEKGDRVTLETGRSDAPDVIYELLERFGIRLDLFHITQVELSASVATAPDERPKRVSIRLTHPNSCSLKYDERDLNLRAMLQASGVEPREPESAE